VKPTAVPACALAAGTAFAAAMMAPSAAQAQTSPDPWQFSAALYAWLPSMSGTSRFPTSGNGPSLDVDGGDVLDALKMTFQGNLMARKGRWGMLADWVYVDLGASKDTGDVAVGGIGIPASATANLSLDLKVNALTFAGTYTAIETPTHYMYLLGGARMLKLEQRLDYSFSGNLGNIQLPGTSGRSQADATNWDAVVGLGGRMRFGEGLRWFVPYYADVGTGESKSTWQFQLGIGYSFKWGDVAATWRYLDYDFKSDSAVQSLTANGPAVGAIFRW
jgi:hypothetical protein